MDRSNSHEANVVGHPRDWNNALGPAISVGIFSIVSYCHQGTILHRSKWDKQTLWLPILYAMSPHIYASQLFLNALLCWNRFHTMRRIYGARQCRDGFLWYLCAILGMHTDSRAFHDPPVFIAGQGREKDQGMLRLNSCESVRLKRRKKSGHENFSRIFCTSRVLWLCLSLYHVVYGLVAYVRRVATLPNATLGIDHLAGTYAINGALVTLANLVLVIQPYEWDDSNHESEEYCEAKSDVDTSNAWVYEGFIALVLQASTWLGMKLWRFGVTLNGPHWRDETGNALQLFADSVSPCGLVLTMLLVIGTTLLVPALKAVTAHGTFGLIWYNRILRFSNRGLGILSRTVLGLMFTSVTVAIWADAALELRAVHHGSLQPWNANWTMPNPQLVPVLDEIWCWNC